MEVKEKFNWQEYIDRVEARGYEFLGAGFCDCGGKRCQIHNDGVIHGKCDNCNWSSTGFGGPNVRSWSAAVAFDNLTEEERQAERDRKRKEIDDKQNRIKRFLLED